VAFLLLELIAALAETYNESLRKLNFMIPGHFGIGKIKMFEQHPA